MRHYLVRKMLSIIQIIKTQYHYKASPSATHPLNKRKEIEKETEKVNLENMSKRRH